ncbi:hypothetical protein V2J09_019273 [Rumex salicifolius]
MEAMKTWHSMALILFFFPLLSLPGPMNAQVGINYGRIADNLPSPTRVAALLASVNITRVKLYDAEPTVLSAFAGSGVDFVVGLGSDSLQNMTDLSTAKQWIQTRILPYINQTRISSISVGNEVLTGSDTQLSSLLVPAMQTLYSALSQLGLSGQVSVTTAQSIGILSNSYPPSSGSFRSDLASYIQPLLNFHSLAKSPFHINAYPYFAYMGDPVNVSLDYALFRSNPGMTDPVTSLHYDNMLYAQIDAVYSAIQAMGHTDIEVRVSETGWASKGDPNEVGSNPQNAAAYNGNLIQRIVKKEGTPAKPRVPIDVYLFALFNEDQKPGPTSERNYGLYYPDESPVYSVGLQANTKFVTTTNYSAAAPMDLKVHIVLSLIILFVVTILL